MLGQPAALAAPVWSLMQEPLLQGLPGRGGQWALTVPSHWHWNTSQLEQMLMSHLKGAYGRTCGADCAGVESLNSRMLGGRHEFQHGALAGTQAVRKALQSGACD